MKRAHIKKRPMADTVLATLEAEAKEYRELDGNGLYLRVKPNGTKSWQLRYKKPNGTWSWLGLGAYGKASHQLSGSQARLKAAELQAEAASGKNLLATTRSRKASSLAAQNNTFQALAREWHQIKCRTWTDGTATRTMGALEKHVFPTFGQRAYTSIQPMEWMELLRSMEQTGIIEQTGRVRGMCRDIYDLARVTGRATHNPLEGLHKFLATKSATNYAHVTPQEFPALLRSLQAYPGAADVRIGLRLLAMLACRPSELREATWAEFDLDAALWLIPAERMKRRREHVLPLPSQALTLLRALHNLTGSYQLLFPGRSNTSQPRSNTAFLMALRRLGYEGRQTGHGFRHLASTILNESGFDSQHIEAQLSHVKEGVRGVYDKSTYLEQRKLMMQWYANHLDELATGNVMEFKRA